MSDFSLALPFEHHFVFQSPTSIAEEWLVLDVTGLSIIGRFGNKGKAEKFFRAYYSNLERLRLAGVVGMHHISRAEAIANAQAVKNRLIEAENEYGKIHFSRLSKSSRH